jgi:hypothetical protein
MQSAKVLAAIGAAAMAAVLVRAFILGDFSGEGSWLISKPWGIVSLVDLYVGFSLFSAWIIYREASLLAMGLWILAVITLGFFAASIYVLLALARSGGDWGRFWMGRRASLSGETKSRVA